MKPSNPLVFEDGDVEICLSRKPQDRLLLHGTLLKIHSSFFKPSLGARWADSSVTDQAQGPIKGRYQLIFDTSETDTLPGLFRAVGTRLTALYPLMKVDRVPRPQPQPSHQANRQIQHASSSKKGVVLP